MTAAAAKMLRQTRMTILLSLNAAAILVAGILIARAIAGNDGFDFQAVNERDDVTKDELVEVGLLGAESSSSNGTDQRHDVSSKGWISSSPVRNGELWNEDSITIYETADIDLCAGGGLSNIGKMYWQTSNESVIGGFYATARTWLGYSSETCRFPLIKGTGTTIITAGTYDGLRRDTITVTVIPAPVEQWKREVLELVNVERRKAGLNELSWTTTCEAAATIRARELMAKYSHDRPDGSSWQTACPLPKEGGWSGENLMAGNAATSPKTAVEAWMNSETHRANILNPNFTKLAVGFVYDPASQYKTYWSQFFTTY